MKYIYILFVTLYWSIASIAQIERPAAVYKPGADAQETTKICKQRYQQELDFTLEAIVPRLNLNLCGMNVADILAIKAAITSDEPLATIAQHYQGLMEKLAQCRMTVLLEEASDISKLQQEFGDDDETRHKIFLHVVGDAFGKNTGFEGGNAGMTLGHRIRVLNVIKEKIGGGHAFINDLDHAQPCRLLTMAQDFYKGYYPHADVPNQFLDKAIQQSELALKLYNLSRGPSLLAFKQGLLSNLNNLPAGESLFFPSSWSGHAIVFELVKEDDEHITFKMFNSGEGSEHHHGTLLSGFSIKAAPYVERKNVPITNFVSLATLSALKDVYAPKGQSTKPMDFYANFLPILGGKVGAPHLEEHEFKIPQIAGTCSYASQPWVMSSCLAQNITRDFRSQNNLMSARLEEMVNLITIGDYGALFHRLPSMHTDEASRLLLGKGLVHESVKIFDAQANNIVSNSELAAIINRLNGIKTQVQQAQQAATDKDKKAIKEFSLSPPLMQAFPALTMVPGIKDLPKAQEIQDAKPQATYGTALEPEKPLPATASLFRKIFATRNRVSIIIGSADKDSDAYTKARNLIETFALTLPLDAQSYSTSQDAVKSTLNRLQDISEYYVYCLLKDMTQGKLPTEQLSMQQLLTTLTFLTVADSINKGSLKIFPSLYSKTWGQLFDDMAVVTITSPAWQKQFAQLKAYWVPDKNEQDFFGFDLIPSGAPYRRRIFDDKNAAQDVKRLKPDRSQWEDDKSFPDIAWALDLIDKLSPADFAAWRAQAEKLERFTPTTFAWRPGPNADKSKPAPALKPKEDLPRNTLENLKMRQAVNIIIGKTPASTALQPAAELFGIMRTLALVPNFMLTGRLDSALSMDNDNAWFGRMYAQNGITFKADAPSSTTIQEDFEHDTEHHYQHIKTTDYPSYSLELNLFGTPINHLGFVPYRENVISIDEVEFHDKKAFTYTKPFYFLSNHQGRFALFNDQLLNLAKEMPAKSLGPALISLFNQAFANKEQHDEPLTRMRLSANQVIRTSDVKKKVPELGFELTRSLLNLSAEHALQLDKTLNFFAAHPHLLAQGNVLYQDLFKNLMFDQSLLYGELGKPKGLAFAKRLADFAKKSFAFYQKNHDVQAVVFVLLMNDLFKQHSKAVLSDTADGLVFLDSDQEFNTLIATLKPDADEQKSYIYAHMMSMYTYRLVSSPTEAHNLLTAAIFHKMVSIKDEMWRDEQLEKRLGSLLVTNLNSLLDQLNLHQNDILNKVAKTLWPSLNTEGLAWVQKPSTALYQLADHKIDIDVALGVAYKDQQQQVAFPLLLSEYHKAFGMNAHPPASIQHLSGNVYQWIDATTGNLVRASVFGGSGIFQIKKDGTWFQLLHEIYVSKMQASKSVMPDKLNWIEITPTDPAIRRIYIADRKTGQFIARTTLKGDTPISITSIPQDNDLINSDKDPVYSIFSALEDDRHIYVWAKQKEVQEISLPRLKLTFKTLAQGQGMDCALVPGYKIASDQYVSALGMPKNYVVCEAQDPTSKAAKKVLMVAQELETKDKDKDKALKPSHVDQKRDVDDFNRDYSKDIIMYQWDGKNLQAESKAARYYLALRFYWQQNYWAAKDLLTSQGSDLGPLLPQEKSILSWFHSPDLDTRAQAIRLTTLYILGQDFLHHDEYPWFDFGDISGRPSGIGRLLENYELIYHAYLSNLGVMDTGLLSLKEELAIAGWFLKHIEHQELNNPNRRSIIDERVKNRHAWLASGKRETNIADPAYFDPALTDTDDPTPRAQLWQIRQVLNPPYEPYFEKSQKVLKLDARNVISKDSFPLLYKLAGNEKLSSEDNVTLKKLLTSLVDHHDDVVSLDFTALRKEILDLLRIVATGYPGNNDSDVRGTAQFLVDVAKEVDAGNKNFPPWAQLLPLMGKEPPEQIVLEQWQQLYDGEFGGSVMAGPVRPAVTPPRLVRKTPPLREVMRTPWQEPALFEGGQHNDPLSTAIAFDEHIFEPIPQYHDELTVAYNNISKNLAQAGTAQGVSRDIKDGLLTLKDRLDATYQDLRLSKLYGIKDWGKLLALKDTIGERIRAAQQILSKLENEIKTLAHAKDAQKLSSNQYELLRLADMERAADINDVVYALLTNKLESFYNLNGAMNKEKVLALKQFTIDYVMRATEHAHLQAIADTLVDVEKHQGKSSRDADLLVAAQSLHSLLSTKRAYDIKAHPEYVVFEYFNKKLMRQNQKDALDILAIKDGHITAPKQLGEVFELIMGAGKTSFIAPLLSAMITNKGFLNVVVLPESLITSMAQELDETMAKSFKKHIDVLIFGQGVKLNKASIPILKQRLLDAKDQGRTIVTTNSSLQSLFITLINLLDQGDFEDALTYPPRQELKEIFKLFREKGILVIDEVDLALDVMRALQIAAGQKLPIADVIKDTVSALYQVMAQHPDIHQKWALPFLPYAQGKAVFADSFSAFKKDVIEKLLEFNEQGRTFLAQTSGLDQSMRSLLQQDDAKELVKDYWLKPTVKNREQLLARIQDEKLKDVVAIIAEELNGILVTCATKKQNIHYGKLPVPQKVEGISPQFLQKLESEYAKSQFVAIPYRNGTPLVQSRFASALEQVNYTIQKDLMTDNYVDYLKLELAELKKMGLANPNFTPRYQKLMGEFSHKDINNLTDEDVSHVAQSYRGQKRVADQIRLIKKYALSQITTFEKQLSTNAQIYEFLFSKVYGFSGTLSNFQTFPDVFNEPHLSDTSPLTLLTLLTQGASVLTLEPNSLESLVGSIYENWQQPGSLIDEGGLFRGYDNKMVAKAIIKAAHDSSVEGVIFYDETDNLAIMDKSANVTLLSASNIPQDKRVAYWDKQHTTGSDLKLKSRMQAKMTVDRHVKLRDIEQASWRLRGLKQGQRVVQYIVMKEDANTMAHELAERFGLLSNASAMTPLDIFMYAIINQQQGLQFLTWRSFGQRLKNKLIKDQAAYVFDTSISSADSVKRYKEAAHELFTSGQPKHLYAVYGLPSSNEKRDDAIKQELATVKSYLAYRYSWGQTYPGKKLGELDRSFAETIDKHKKSLPDDIKMPNLQDQGTEVQIELNTQTQTQTQAQTQTTQMDPDKPAPADIVKSWDLSLEHERVFTRAYFEERRSRQGEHKLLYTQDECVQHSPKLAVLFNSLDKQLMFSANFAPLDTNFAFFDQYGKEIAEVLVVYDNETKTYSLIIPDLNDTKQWKEFLGSDNGSAILKPRELKIGMYSLLSNTMVAQGFERFDDQALAHDNQFLSLIVQAKFLGGIVSYSAPEKPLLQAWLNAHDTDQLARIFKSYIMSYKDFSLQQYYTSFIAEIFGDQ